MVVVHQEPGLGKAATFVRLDLIGNGYESTVAVGEIVECTEVAAGRHASGAALVSLTSEDGERVEARVCIPGTEPLQTGVVYGSLEDPQSLSILVTEALNGLLAERLPRTPAVVHGPGGAPAQERPRVEPQDGAPVVVEVQGRLLWDAPTTATWSAVVPRVGVPLTDASRFDVEFLASVLPSTYSEPEMDLRGSLAWAQIGVSGSRREGDFRLDYGLAAGPYVARVAATARSPWTSGTDSAFGAVLSARGTARFPATSRWFVSGGVGVSTLVPRFRYQLSSSTTPDFGALLFEGTLGFGIRL